jgi:hypothetical protein
VRKFGPYIDALVEEQRPGHCAVCDNALPPQEFVRDAAGHIVGGSIRKRLCANKACRHEYNRLSGLDAKHRRRLAAAIQKQQQQQVTT